MYTLPPEFNPDSVFTGKSLTQVCIGPGNVRVRFTVAHAPGGDAMLAEVSILGEFVCEQRGNIIHGEGNLPPSSIHLLQLRIPAKMTGDSGPR